MSASKAQQKAVNKYMNVHYDRINLVIPKGRKAALEQRSKENGESVNSYLNRLIRDDLGLSEEAWRAWSEREE